MSEDLIKDKYFQNIDDEINLGHILKFILRNKRFIASISVTFFVVSCIYSLTLKRLWEGRFEIVLEKKESKTPPISLPTSISSLGGLSGRINNDLKTEIGILESPSVLMPIFEFVKNNQVSKNDTLRFKPWKSDSLSFELKEETSILQISYRDTKKDIIIPVLNKISKTYQDYSGKNKRRNLELLDKYLTEQIEIFRNKSSESLKLVQEFAVDQDLLFVDFDNPGTNLEEEDQNFLTNISIENVRVKAANQIRIIDLQLSKIEEMGNDLNQLQYIGSTIPSLVQEGLPQSLKNFQEQLVEFNSRYTKNDPLYIAIVEKRNRMVNLLKERTVGFLKAQKLLAEARMNAASRPKGILTKYKELLRLAQRDEATLITLENELRLFQLEKAKYEDPWQLITDPTLLKYPVAPSRRLIGLAGLLIGFFISTLISFIKEKKSGLIYDSQNLEKSLLCPFFKIRCLEKDNIDLDSLIYLRDFISNLEGKNLSFLFPSSFNKSKEDLIKSMLKDFLKSEKERKLSFFNSKDKFKEFLNYENNFLIICIGNSSFAELSLFKDRLKLFNIKLSGIIIIE